MPGNKQWTYLMEMMYRTFLTATWMATLYSNVGAGVTCPEDEVFLIGGNDQAMQCLDDLMQFDDAVPSILFNVRFWNDYCRQEQRVRGCLMEAFRQCPDSDKERIVKYALHSSEWLTRRLFPQESVCDGVGEPSTSITQLYSSPGITCRKLIFSSVNKCLYDWADVVISNETLRYVESLYTCVAVESSTAREQVCSNSELSFFLLDQMVPPLLRTKIKKENIMIPLTHESLFSAERSTVGVFGDPHIEVFGADELITCRARNTYEPYLVNEVFTIRAKGIPASHYSDSQATFLDAVRIEFVDENSAGMRVLVGAYNSFNGNLRDLFDDGSRTIAAGKYEVTLTSEEINTRTIRITELAVIIDIYRWNAYFNVAVRMSNSLYGRSHGLLVGGCRQGDLVLDQGQTPEVCEETCSALTNQGRLEFTRTCEYDCTATQNFKVVRMITSYLSSRVRLNQMDAELQLIRPVPPITAKPSMDDNPSSSTKPMLIFLTAVASQVLAFGFCLTESWTVM